VAAARPSGTASSVLVLLQLQPQQRTPLLQLWIQRQAPSHAYVCFATPSRPLLELEPEQGPEREREQEQEQEQ